jgi:hypothetical protein
VVLQGTSAFHSIEIDGDTTPSLGLHGSNQPAPGSLPSALLQSGWYLSGAPISEIANSSKNPTHAINVPQSPVKKQNKSNKAVADIMNTSMEAAMKRRAEKDLVDAAELKHHNEVLERQNEAVNQAIIKEKSVAAADKDLEYKSKLMM